jgi:hypothetical protein
MKASLPAADVAYGLLRKKFQVEAVGDVAADTVKFVFVYWFPDSGVPLARKMKVGTFEGDIKKLFQPYQVDVNAGNDGELTEEIITTLLENVTGKADKTMAPVAAAKAAAPVRRSFLGGMDNKTQDLEMVDQSAIIQAIADVRNDDKPEAEWCIAEFDQSDPKVPKLKLKAVGANGLDVMKSNFSPDSFNFAFFRLTEVIDKTTAVKFCFIKSQPEATPFRLKGKLGLKLGAVAAVFAPYHGDLVIDLPEELTLDGVVEITRKK